VVSTELKGTIVSRTGIDESMVQIVRVPVDDSVESGDGESLGEALNVRENTVISTVTNLRFEEKYRGVVELFPGMTRFLAENKDAAWVIAGGGYYQQLLEDALQDEINDEDVLSRIYTPGYIENIEDVYDLSTVKVYNSYLDGYPNVVIEAQAAGVPVVTTEQEGMQEQVDHKRTGLFFDPADPAELMAALNRLTSDEQFAREIRERARESVNTRNHPETIAQQFRRALEAITRRASDL
jgi:glycosyltransferase involved in cell wall biosynthesis